MYNNNNNINTAFDSEEEEKRSLLSPFNDRNNNKKKPKVVSWGDGGATSNGGDSNGGGISIPTGPKPILKRAQSEKRFREVEKRSTIIYHPVRTITALNHFQLSLILSFLKPNSFINWLEYVSPFQHNDHDKKQQLKTMFDEQFHRRQKLKYIQYFLSQTQKFRLVSREFNRACEIDDDYWREFSLLYSDYLLAYPLKRDLIMKDAEHTIKDITQVIPCIAENPVNHFHSFYVKAHHEHQNWEQTKLKEEKSSLKARKTTYSLFIILSGIAFLMAIIFCILLCIKDIFKVQEKFLPLFFIPLGVNILVFLLAIPLLIIRLSYSFYHKAFIAFATLQVLINVILYVGDLVSINLKIAILPLIDRDNFHWSIFLSPIYATLLWNCFAFWITFTPFLVGFFAKFTFAISNCLIHLSIAVFLILLSIFLEMPDGEDGLSFAFIFSPLYTIEAIGFLALLSRIASICYKEKDNRAVTIQDLVPNILLLYIPLSLIIHHIGYTLHYFEILPEEFNEWIHLINIIPLGSIYLAFLSNFKK